MKGLVGFLFSIILIVNIFFLSCDNGEVLIDEVETVVYYDSLRVFRNIPDSIQMTFTTTSDWHVAVARGGEWCRISVSSGSKGRNSFMVYVDENPSAEMRQTSVILESGNVKRITKVFQEAGEEWFETFYWDRTSAQRMGFRHKVRSFTVTYSGSHFNDSYDFDERGNLLRYVRTATGTLWDDTTRLYRYDADNHRLECLVLNHDSTVVREYRYEYGNPGAYVAYDQEGWLDQDPLAEDFSGSVVPGLSAAHKLWYENGFRMGQDRYYSFDSSGRLVIISREWKHRSDFPDDTILTNRDTVRIEYRNKLPYTSRKVMNTVYYKNGMIRMFEKNDSRYELPENCQKMVISAYSYTGTELNDRDIEWYNATYNYNRDILERDVKYSGMDQVKDQYTRYQYDPYENWGIREEAVVNPANGHKVTVYVHRDFDYY